MENNNRQGCRWTKGDVENIISMVCDQFGAGFAGRREFIEKTIEEYLKKQPITESLIEPCATSSENYWKQRCEAAEKVIDDFNLENIEGNWNAMSDVEKWQQLKNKK